MIFPVIFSVFFVVFSPADALHGPHGITREKIRLNAQIKEEFSEIVRIKNIPSHYDFGETLDEILTVLKEDDQLLRLKHDDAALIYEPNLNEGYEKIFWLAFWLLEFSNKLMTFHQTRPMTCICFCGNWLHAITSCSRISFTRRRRFILIVHVVPIGKLKNEPNTFLLGVIGKRKEPSSDSYLKGIAGILVDLDKRVRDKQNL
ncbi:hypothetical protein DdX_18810 [Ditylenchus destructor]|uniref:Uncharacterized protein n=1 Tax=Ditylenchus destructor TaxID=166010 RepID=A0AAD4MPC1_9BILA|nr:hypothetical protein DdX_18810 [Ditylenchus destructor]